MIMGADKRVRKGCPCWWALVLVATLAWAPGAPAAGDTLEDLDLEQLMALEVTSAARKPQTLSQTASAVFVITARDIRRSGARSIPEALRMVPGLQVARIDGSKWAISARGFADRFGNKLLVLMDGRSLYSTEFSGVYWEVQDSLLEDVERIEVIRGPGATLWGANAVNGIINIITKKSTDTVGGLGSFSLGTDGEVSAAARHGAPLGPDAFGRLYVKGQGHGALDLAEGGGGQDDWRQYQGGFRVDWTPSWADRVTVQGDAYGAELGQTLDLPLVTYPFLTRSTEDVPASGWNLLGSWERQRANGGMKLQAYLDSYQRSEVWYGLSHETLDLDYSDRQGLGGGHELQWGLGYRQVRDILDSTQWLTVLPHRQTTRLYSGFFQYDYPLVADRWRLSLGSKLEHNDYTGFELQPNARLLWSPSPTTSAWAAISQAARTPSRTDRDMLTFAGVSPTGLASPALLASYILGSEDFDAEHLTAHELGFRKAFSTELSLDLAAFYNVYRDLRSYEKALLPSDGGSLAIMNVTLDNQARAHTFGLELAADWRPTPSTQYALAYSWWQSDVSLAESSTDTNTLEVTEGGTPHHQVSLRGSFDLTPRWDLDLWYRYVDALASPSARALTLGYRIPAYHTLDARLAWRPRDDLELSLVGKNLLGARVEFLSELYTPPATEVDRSLSLILRLDF